MAYQGISPYLYRNNLTNVQLLDDISGSFNGTTTQFNLTTNGSPFHAVSARSLLIILGGIVQEPDADYTVNAGVITFTTAPLSGLTFAARNIYGLNRLTGINDGLVTPASLSLGGPEWDTSGNLTVDGNITQTGETNNVYINTDTPTVRPTLDLNFERDQRLDSRITYSRNSTATYLGSDGLIKTALVNEPRFEFDTDGNCLGFLIEESRTNIVSYSQQFDNSYWAKAGGGNPGTTVTANQAVAPDGTATADYIDYTTAITNSKLIERTFDNTPAGKTYTGSVWIKGTAGQTINLILDGYGVDVTGEQYTLDGTWQRLSITRTYGPTFSADALFRFGVRPLGLSAGTANQVYAWGAQIEVGSFATSYIPTTTTSVTRAVDEATITGTNFTDWYNPTEGSIFAKYSAGTNVSEVPFAITKTGSEISDVIAIGASSSGSISGVLPTLVVADDGVIQTGITITINPVDGDTIKTAIAYKENDFAISSGIDTESGFASDSSGTIPTVDIARIGKYPYYGIWQNRPIARILYYPQRLSNSQLQNLTS
jgi:hypothetical protein